MPGPRDEGDDSGKHHMHKSRSRNRTGSMLSRREQARRRAGDGVGMQSGSRAASADHLHAQIALAVPCARRMIPLESPVPEIGTPGSESRGWKRDDGEPD